MIESISIDNLGVIEHAELNFGEGLTVLTGETGAGKTMVLTSLHLLLGRRADPGIVRQGTEGTLVDGIFTVPEHTAQEARNAGAHVEDDELIISRSVPTQGRSRARIGGRPVPAGILSEISSQLVTIHGQADQIALKSAQAQGQTLDNYGDAAHHTLLSEYEQAWAHAVAAKRALDTAQTNHSDREREIANLSEVLEQFDALEIHPGEEDELRAETERLTNVEDLRDKIARARTLLTEVEGQSVSDLIRSASDEIRHAIRFDHSVNEYEQRIESLRLELEALSDDLAIYLRGLEADPTRLAQLHERRAAIRELLRGRAADTEELIEWAKTARERLHHLTESTASPEECQRALEEAQQRVLAKGHELTESREKLAHKLSTAVTTELQGLAMSNATFSIELRPQKPTASGLEQVNFLLQPHPDMAPSPLGQGASGGELSRVMLALEVTLGARTGTPTYIFDEVDAGIGGRTATEVGRRLAQLAQHKQVIVVTHLPQVAAWATTHLVVEKHGATTTVRPVQAVQRVEEIARMMGADENSDVARRHAKALLDSINVPQSKM